MIPTAVSPFAGLDLATWLEDRARERGAHPLLVWAPFEGQARTWSYREFAGDVARVAGGLAARGVRSGDRVLVQLENCPETLLVLFACARLGAIHVPVNAMAAGPELAWYADFSGAAGAVTQPRLAATLATHCPGLRWLVCTATDAGEAPVDAPPAGALRFEALLASEPAPLRTPEPSADGMIMFTSGTTSRPKGVLWTQGNALWAARLGAQQQGLRPDDRAQLFLPLYHVVALAWTFLPALWAGGTVVLQPKFSASRYWPTALEHRCTTGSQVMFTLGVLSRQPVPAHSFRQWLSAQSGRGWEERFGVRIVGAWSMTEVLTQVIVGDPWQPQPPGSIGRPSSAYAVHVVDDDGRPLQGPGTGHLLVGGVRGLSLFKSYYRNPEATAEAFDDEGRFRTGDRVTVDAAGFVYFADRARDVIKVGGESVSPAEIERVLQELPFVQEAAVVGRTEEGWGEVAVAFVVPRPGFREEPTGPLVEQALAHCRAALAKFKVPREVIVVPDLPRIGFGKVAKVKLRELAQARQPA